MTDEEIRAALAEALRQHRKSRPGATCTCGWHQAVPKGSDAPAYAAWLLWGEHRLAALLPTVSRLMQQQAAEELRAAAEEYRSKGLPRQAAAMDFASSYFDALLAHGLNLDGGPT